MLGLRGTGNWATGQRPTNWREAILYKYPNSKAPLTALMAMLESEATDDPEYKWWSKDMPTQRFFINNAAGYVAGDTILLVDDALGVGQAGLCKRGTVLMVERTGEKMWVTTDPAVATTITVGRGKGTTAAAALVDDDPMLIIGTAYAEGESTPTPYSWDPTKEYNFTQIFRTPLSLTRTAKKTRLRTADQYRESKREALLLHSIQMERAYWFGERYFEIDTTNGMPKRTTGGILSYITTNVFTPGGFMWPALWDAYMMQVFAFGNPEKLCFAGAGFLAVLHQLWQYGMMVTVSPGEGMYGMDVTKYVCPFGTLYFKMHPLFSEHPAYTYDGVILDLPYIKERYIDQTAFLTNRQGNGQDLRLDEYLTESGLEMANENCHSYIHNMCEFVPTEPNGE